MTAEKRWSVKLSDIQAVLLECKDCHSTNGFPPQRWGSIPYGCPNCSNARMPENSLEHKTLEAFRVGLLDAIKHAAVLKFEIRFEFDGSTETGS